MREDLYGGGDELNLLAARYPIPEPDSSAIWKRVEAAREAGGRASARGRSTRVARWAAAAALAAVVVGGMLVPGVRAAVEAHIAEPVRSWGVERLTGVSDWLTARETAGSGANPTRSDADVTGAPPANRIAFIPKEVLELDIQECQEHGSLTVRRHTSPEASLEAVGGTSAAHLARSTAGFVVANPAGSKESYQLLVPHGVRQVWIHLGSRSILLPMRAADPGGWTLFLQSPDGSDAVGHCRP